jgi:hypothetical protein
LHLPGHEPAPQSLLVDNVDPVRQGFTSAPDKASGLRY